MESGTARRSLGVSPDGKVRLATTLRTWGRELDGGGRWAGVIDAFFQITGDGASFADWPRRVAPLSVEAAV